MKKIINIEGMSCGHCQARVEKALSEIPGLEVKVDLKKKAAIVSIASPIEDDELKAAVTNAGYEVTSIEEKKGLFGK